VGMTTATAAEDGGSAAPPPSLEYRPKRPVIPEPKAPQPLPPKTVFTESIGGRGMLAGSFDGPVDVDRDASGNFYALDVGNNRVQVFDRFGTLKFSWGSRGFRQGRVGKLDSEFNKPSAIAVGPESSVDATQYVYVLDSGNHRVQKFNLKGEFVIEWGSLGSSDGDFKSPQDIVVDRWGVGQGSQIGDVVVLDSGNERVQQFSNAGKFKKKLEKSSFGVTGGNFTNLKSIALSDQRLGYFYLLGAGCVVQQFTQDGTLVNSWAAVAPESGLCVPARLEIDEKNHYVYVLDSGNSLLMCYNPDGMYRWALRGAQEPFSRPLGFAVNADGDEFLVADTENNVVQKFTLR